MTTRDSQPSPKRSRRKWLIVAIIALGVFATVVALRFRPDGNGSSQPAMVNTKPGAISCLGRIEPDFEVIKLSAPASLAGPALLAQLKIEEGEEIKSGRLIATLDNRDRLQRAWEAAKSRITVAEQRLAQVKAGPKPADLAAQRAEIARLQAELDQADREQRRAERLFQHGDTPAAEVDTKRAQRQTSEQALKQAEERLKSLAEVREVDVNYAQSEIAAAVAETRRAKAELDQAYIYSPVSGRVVKINTRAGEQIGPAGIAEIAKTDRMYAVAEVYETDIGRVKTGRQATITCDALSEKLIGKVERIGMRAIKNTVLNPNPASFSDARVVEVKILLDDPQKVAGLINARVTVSIEP